MSQIFVNAERIYSIDFVRDWRSKLSEATADKQVCVLMPRSMTEILGTFPPQWLIIELPEGELQKSGTVYLQALEQLAEAGFTRSCVVVGIGGGATTDLAGFVAASFLRGVEWLAIPTSLAAMVDAAIGGKTGINLDAGKNLAGAFYSPSKVIIDESFLSSLSQRDLKAGLAEVAKCGFISDPEILHLISQGWNSNLSELIKRAIEVKAKVVGVDFRESFEREILNYGHTLGHAIERHSNYELRHGECVAIGIIYAGYLSERLSGLAHDDAQLHRSIIGSLDLPTSYRSDAWPQLYQLMSRDKKNRSHLRFVTLSSIGKPVRLENPNPEILKEIYLDEIGR